MANSSGNTDLVIDFDTMNLLKVVKAFDRIIAQITVLNQVMSQTAQIISSFSGARISVNGAGGGGARRAPAVQSFGQQLMKVFSSSRFGAGGLMPLVGQVAKLLGPPGMAFVAVVAAGLALMKAFYDLTKQAAELGRAFASIGYSTGSSTGSNAALAGLSGSTGLSGAELGALSRSLNESLKTGLGVAAGSKLGIQANFSPFANDFAPTLLKAADKLWELAHTGHRNEAIQIANQLGAQALLPSMDRSAYQKAKSEADAMQKASVMTPEFLEHSADFIDALGRLGSAFGDFVVTTFGPFLPFMTAVLNGLADTIRDITNFILPYQNKMQAIPMILQAWITDIIDVLTLGKIPGLRQASDILNRGAKDLWNKPVDPIKDQTAATKDLTAEMRIANKEGIFGGGDRARSAFPKEWMKAGNNVTGSQHLLGHAMALGAFQF